MIKKIKKAASLIMITALSICMIGCSNSSEKADKDKITLILSTGGVNDQSFNQSAYEGALKAKFEYGVDITYLESNSDSEYMQNIETAIEMGSDLIVGVGFQLGDDIKEAAQAYPEQQFATIDSEYSGLDNVRAITFSEEEAGYLVGLIAGKTTKTNVVGWIGGMAIPSCENFYWGYEKGVKEVNPEAKILKQFTNSFVDAAKGKIVAQQMINENADIIFTLCGAGNSGTLEAVKENNIQAIGVDMPMSHIEPQYILTSALKNVGEGVRLTIEDYVKGDFTSGEVKYNLSNGGVGYEKTELLSSQVMKFVDDKISSSK